MIVQYREPFLPRIENRADALGALACVALVAFTFGVLIALYVVPFGIEVSR